MSAGTENKNTGSFYTPEWCVDILLDMSGFALLSSSKKISARVIDPACGDGAILCRIVGTSLAEFAKSGFDEDDVSSWVKNNVVGIELDADEAQACRENLADICSRYGIDVEPDEAQVITGDTFEEYGQFEGLFDYVIGNPPYVRIHNLDEKPPSSYITGMCDLYYAFYDIGQKLLANDGVLCYIAPSSWMTNEAGCAMRKDLEDKGAIRSILDFAHYQVFDNATTYTAIVTIGKSSYFGINIWEFDEASGRASIAVAGASLEDIWCKGKFYPHGIAQVREVLTGDWDSSESDIFVRNGYATLCDKAYIQSSDEELDGYVIDAVKASRGKYGKILYPYDEDGKLVPIAEIEANAPQVYHHLADWKDALLTRNKIDPSKWWGYGRSQGIADTYSDKCTVQSIVRPDRDIVIAEAPAGCGVYSGLYVLGMEKEELERALSDAAFMEYVIALAKYKSGGYYTFSGKELQRYLKWWDSKRS